eukprot:SAG11_NODE_33721_length_275_cov_2.250000_1_plen_64_part_10
MPIQDFACAGLLVCKAWQRVAATLAFAALAQPGQEVVVHGLLKAAAFNGKRGRIVVATDNAQQA